MAAVASLWTHLPAKKIRHGSMQVDDSPSSNLRCFHHCAPASFSGQPTGELDFICSRTHGRVYIRQSNVVRALKYRKIFDASYVDEEPIKSPFTEKDSIKLSRGQGINAQEICPPILDTLCAENGGQTQELNESQKHSYEQNDIAARLPELEGMLALLKGQLAKEGKSARKGPGNVYLIGTGPGDPDLLTLKAVKLMQTADLVLYDRLVSTDILEMVHPEAKLLYVGKTSGYHSRTQDEIHELLLSFAEVGATVLRLKGGDPLVFGRGGEEMDFLQEQGIRVTIIPGITAASGIAAELGIPLTHRGIANSVRFLTGHSRKGGKDPLHVAEHAADPDSTLVVYMGLATLPALAAKLMDNGLPPETPAAAIERGTTAQQRTVFAPLEDLAAEVSLMQLVSPTLIFIGQVVALSPYWPFGRSMTTDKLAIHQEPRDRRLRNPDPSLPSQRIQ